MILSLKALISKFGSGFKKIVEVVDNQTKFDNDPDKD